MTREDIEFRAGGATSSRVVLACTFNDAGDLVDFEVVPDVIARDEHAKRLAKRLTQIARRVREDGLSACVADALHWWQILDRLQLIQTQRDKRIRDQARRDEAGDRPCARR